MKENKSNLFNSVKNKTGAIDNEGDYGIVNPNSGASIVTRDDGNINLTSDQYTQIKIDKNSSAIVETSLSSSENTVIKELNAVDIKINKHKFNNQLIELSDFRNVNGNVIGNMMMNGTVLVKTWEPTLEKWVLIRRPIATTMFSSRLNIPSTPEQLEVDLNVMADIKKYYINKEE